MLAGMTPEQFDEWMAEHNREPWGDDWKQAGTIAAVIENHFQRLIAAFAKEEPPTTVEATDYYRPAENDGDAPRQRKRYLTPEESERLARMQCGV